MRARRLEHADVLAGHLRPPGPFHAWFAQGEFSDGEQALASDGDAHECTVGSSGVALTLELPEDAEAVPEPPVCVVVPRPGGLLYATLGQVRGGPRHFVSAPPAFWTWCNRRTAYRVALNQTSRAEKGGEPLLAVLLDLSIGGGRVRLPFGQDDVEPGERLRVVLPVPGDPWADAEVVRVTGAGRSACTCGVRWLELSASVEQRLANFVFSHERAALKKLNRR